MSDTKHSRESSGSLLVERLPAADFPVRVAQVFVPPPTDADPRTDVGKVEDGLCEQLGTAEVEVPVSVARDLPAALQAGERMLSVVVRASGAVGDSWAAIKVRPAEDGFSSYLAVVDMGLDAVWGQLLDVETGRVVETAAILRQNREAGSDREKRWSAADRADTNGEEAVAAIREIVDALGRQCSAAPGSIEHVVVAGSAATTSLLLGIESDYVQTQASPPTAVCHAGVPAAGLGLGTYVSEGAAVRTPPTVGRHLGGDMVGGMVVSGVANTDSVSLYVDIGTRAGAAVGNREWLLATSWPTASAFDGAGLHHGMPALEGAIEEVVIDPETLRADALTIGKVAPRGVCGSGAMAAVGQLLKHGALLPDGRFRPGLESLYLRPGVECLEYVLAPGEVSTTEGDIVLSEADIALVLQGKAAIFAGLSVLLGAASLRWTDLEKIVVAGGFGEKLRISEAVAVGMFPELDPEAFEFLGNGSLLGARAMAISRRMRTRAEQVASLVNIIELHGSPEFQREQEAALGLPHTDPDRFNSLGRHP